MMKFNFLAEEVTVDGKVVRTDRNHENADWVSDSNGVYAILEIDWNKKEVYVAEIGFDEDNPENYFVSDKYYVTFSDMKNCEH